MSLEILLEKFYNWLITQGVEIAIALVILVVGLKLIKRLMKVLNRVLERKNVDNTLRSFLDAFINISLKIILIVIIMGQIGIETASLTALLGVIGIAVGLAIQGSLSNFAGSVVILFIRPFNVGDYIDGLGHSGTVEKIGMFYTTLLTVDNKVIVIPNGNLANDSIVNYTSMPLRRVDLKFGVAYEEDVLRVKSMLTEIVKNNTQVLSDPEPFIGLSEHADSSVNFVVRAWCKTEDYWNIYFDLLEKVKIKFSEENITIPYPQMDVHIKRDEQ